MFEGGMRVPMIARWPGRIPKGAICRRIRRHAGALPHASGGGRRRARRAGVMLDGFNLLPVLEGQADVAAQGVLLAAPRRQGRARGPVEVGGIREGSGLFDLAADLGEKRDLSADKPDVLRQVKARWAAWRKEMDESEPRGPFRDY